MFIIVIAFAHIKFRSEPMDYPAIRSTVAAITQFISSHRISIEEVK